MAHRLCNTDLTDEAVAISGPDVRPPIWIESLHVVDSELFHYIEYQLLHMRQSFEQILQFLQSHGVHISQQTMFDLIEQIIQLANLLIDHLSTPGSEPINGTDEVDRAIRRLCRGVGMHMPEEGPAHLGDARQAIQSLSSALLRLAMGKPRSPRVKVEAPLFPASVVGLNLRYQRIDQGLFCRVIR